MFELIVTLYILTVIVGLLCISGLIVWMIYPDTAQDFLDDWNRS